MNFAATINWNVKFVGTAKNIQYKVHQQIRKNVNVNYRRFLTFIFWTFNTSVLSVSMKPYQTVAKLDIMTTEENFQIQELKQNKLVVKYSTNGRLHQPSLNRRLTNPLLFLATLSHIALT